MNSKSLLQTYRKEKVQRIKLGITDTDGVIRGKYISLDKFASIVDKTSGFCDCIFGWDVDDQLYDNAEFTGWHTAFPDALYRIDLTTERRLPDEANTPYFIIDLVDKDGKSLHPISPRSLLQRVLQQAKAMGLQVQSGFEYEFFVFDETPHSIREKNYQNLTPLSPGNFGYSVLRNSAHSDLFHAFMDYCQAINIPLEGLHCETGPGVWEAALQVNDALTAADNAALFKTFAKVFFNKQDKVATFMAKWSMQYPGQSGHLHQSLSSTRTQKNIFYDKKGANNISTKMESYIAGLQTYLKPFLALYAPTINSYTRLVKGAWAPTTATWGIENRTTAIRAIPGSEKSQRVELRVCPADANPYLAAAASIGSGLLGIQKGLKPSKPIEGNAYEVEDKLAKKFHLASNLRDATRDFAQSPEAKSIFGQDFVQHYTASREWEVREHEKSVTDWQLSRYFEII